MNKQMGYITSAHLILFGIAATYFFLSELTTIPAAHNAETTENKNQPAAEFSSKALVGKNIFSNKCATCHKVFKEIAAPPLKDFESRGPWSDRNKLYSWVRNPEKFMETDPYTASLRKKYQYPMRPFPEMSNEQIDAIVEYITLQSGNQ